MGTLKEKVFKSTTAAQAMLHVVDHVEALEERLDRPHTKDMTESERRTLRGATESGRTHGPCAGCADAVVDAAREVMAALEEHGGSIVPHLMDTDDNAGQRLRDALGRYEDHHGEQP